MARTSHSVSTTAPSRKGKQIRQVYVPCGCALRWALLAMALQMLMWACQGVVVAGVGSRVDAAVAAAAGAETASGRPCDHT
jgi:hypothetical protein